MHNYFSENLKKIRKDHNLSQEQLADEIGVSRQAISKWESAVAYPEMDKILSLCDKFNLNIDDLLHKDIKELKGEEESKKKVNKAIDDFLKFITDTIDLFSSMSFKSKIKCLMEQIIIISILLIISGGIFLTSNTLIFNILSFLPDKIHYFIGNIFETIIIIFCVIFTIIILTHIFKTRYLDYFDRLKNIKDDSNCKEKNFSMDDKNNLSFKQDTNKIIIRDPKHSEYRFINGLFKLIIGIIKFFALCLSAFISLFLISLFCAFIISFLAYKTGFLFVGLLSTIISSAVITIIILLIILNFVFNRKSDKKKMIFSFITSLVVFGIGWGFIFIGVLNFEVLNKNEGMLKTEKVNLDMQDNMFFNFYNDDIQYVEKDINNIELEYQVNKYCEAKIDNQGKYGIGVWGFCSDPIKLSKVFIQNFNDKKIISISNEIPKIVVYASKKNIDKIKNNAEKYLESQEKYDGNIRTYENIISKQENEIEDYQDKIVEYERQILEQQELIENCKPKENE